MRFAMAAALAILLTVRRGGAPLEPRLIRLTAATTGAGDAGCASYAEARLGRPAAETVAEVPPDWADWIADLDDRMTGTCR
ncbi:hypothetical protein [Rubellimicrobium thermophilum]|nr:hypothetical protein [Rubellimicrobium thermophilum]